MVDCIKRNLSGGEPWRLPVAGVLAAMIVTVLVHEPRVTAQTLPGKRPTFEVASVKPQRDYPKGYHHPVFENGRFTATAPLIQLIAFAYHVPLNPSKRLSGGPDWIRGADGFYDIKAIGSLQDASNSSDRVERGRLMLQALLADRFRLAIHREMREMPAYVLVVDKGGPRLENSGVSEKDCLQPVTDAQIPCHQVWGAGGSGLRAQAATMADLVSYAENWTDRPLLDKTGLRALYKIETQPFLPMELPAKALAFGTKTDAGDDVADLSTLFQVFQKFGLRMRGQKELIETYVIDSVERPTDN